MIKKSILLFVFGSFCGSVFSQALDTTKCLFFVDSKQVFAKVVYDDYEFKRERLEFQSGDYSTRRILLRYGEKYRNNQVMIFKTRKKDEESD